MRRRRSQPAQTRDRPVQTGSRGGRYSIAAEECATVDERCSEVGGDEETRTPDPLLAKEMLCQLSYVPRPRGWWAFLDSNQRPLPYQGSALTS